VTVSEILYRIEIISLSLREPYAGAVCRATGPGELTVYGCSDAVLTELKRTLPFGTTVANGGALP
jgi:hypothetical protein